MKSAYTYKGAVWIDLVNPTVEEVNEVREKYDLKKEVANELLSPSSSHVVEMGPKHAYLVLHFPAFKDSTKGDAAFELDFVVGENYVITARYEKVAALEKHVTTLADSGLLDAPTNARDVIFFGILRELLHNFEEKLSNIDHWVREIEKQMFAGKEKRTIFELSEASRHLIDFKKITAVYPDSFQTLKEKGQINFGKEFSEFSDEILTKFNKAKLKLEMLSETVRELRETNNSLLSAKQNEFTKILAIIALITDVLLGGMVIYLSIIH